MSMKIDKRRNLVIAAVGDQSLHTHWKLLKRADFDLFLIYYGDNEGYEQSSRYHVRKKGTKFHLIADMFDERPDLFEYEYIWMPDDDIYIKSGDVERLFKLAKRYDLWLCQPSIIGWYGLDVTLHHKNSILRYTNYVEIMCPCFQSEALRKCISTFRENKTGWGIDSVWNIKLEHPTDRIAVVDDVVAIHTRPVGGGDMYKKQANNSIDNALKEAYELYDKYDMAEENYIDLKNGKAVSQESFSTRYFNTVEYGRLYKSTEAGVPVEERMWPPIDILRTLCEEVRASRSSETCSAPNLCAKACDSQRQSEERVE